LSLDQDEEDQTGGGCYTYQKCLPVTYSYYCANDQLSRGSTQHCFYKSGGHCGGTGSGGGSFYYGGVGYHGGSGSPGSTPIFDEKILNSHNQIRPTGTLQCS